MALTAKQKHDMKKFIKELESYRGSHTELVSVYIPAAYDMNKVINHLFQEQGTASNIKSASTRKNVIDALERMIQHLRLFKRTPENGLAAFAGNVASRDGRHDLRVWSVEPPVPVKTRIYRCDKQFLLDILGDMMDVKELYGMIVMDRREGTVAFLKGKTIIPLVKSTSNVPGKTRAGGQCLIPDSLVQLSNGSLNKIETVHNPHIVKSVMVKSDFSIQDSNITDKWDVKKSEIYKIITKNPRLEIQSSKDHAFFVAAPEGIIEKAAEELKEGNFLIMPEKIDIKGKRQKLTSEKYYNSFIINKGGQELLKQKRLEKKLLQKQLAEKTGMTQTAMSVYELGKRNARRKPLKKICAVLDIDFEDFLKKHTTPRLYRPITLPEELNEEFAQFLGYYVGDGCIETDRITLFEQDKQVALHYKEKFDNFFKMSSSYKFRKSKNYHQIRFTSRPLVRLIENEFPELKKSSDSEIPEKILQSKDSVVAAFLRGLFDAEGYVHKKRGIGLGINNKKLAQQVQLALLRFSIISSLHEYDNRANKYSNNPRYTIDITEKKSLELFKTNMNFSSYAKIKKLVSVTSNKSDMSRVRQTVVPGRKIRELIEKAGYNLELFPKVSNFFVNKRMMSKQTFKNSILPNIKNKQLYAQLNNICNYPVLPVKINKIEKIHKKTEMIDISVKSRNFIANGVIVHNSAHRFERLREGAAKDFFNRLAEHVKKEFFGNPNLKGVLLGGPGPTKYDFMEHLQTDIKNKVIAVKDLSYTGEFGLQELLDKCDDVLAKEDVMAEKKVMAKFFDLLAKQPGKVSYGENEVMGALQMGAVDTLLLSEELDDKKIEDFEEKARNFGTAIEIISTETREGVQLRNLGKIAAILRYEVNFA